MYTIAKAIRNALKGLHKNDKDDLKYRKLAIGFIAGVCTMSLINMYDSLRKTHIDIHNDLVRRARNARDAHEHW